MAAAIPVDWPATDIPLEARVVAVADVWDALTSDRAYRKGWAPDMALAHIRDGAGTHFDPLVVDALVRLVAGWGITDSQGGHRERRLAGRRDLPRARRRAPRFGLTLIQSRGSGASMRRCSTISQSSAPT